MVDGVDVAKRKSVCRRCGKVIPVGELRGWKYDDYWGTMGGKNYFCKQCAVELLNSDLHHKRELLNELTDFIVPHTNLTFEQEDFIIEEGLERWREEREWGS